MQSSSQPRGSAKRRALTAVAWISGALLLGACFQLDIANPNGLNRDTVFNNASNAEAALIGGFRRYYNQAVGRDSGSYGNASSLHQITPVWGNEFANVLAATSEPRDPIDNVALSSVVTRGPWYDPLGTIAIAREVYNGIEANGLRFGGISVATPNGADTPRARIFAKFLIAISNLQLALRFDQGHLHELNTNIDTLKATDFKPSAQVNALAIRQLREVIADSKAAAEFSIPPTWINGQTVPRDEFVRIVYSYIARANVYQPRTPALRAAVNWQSVLTLLDSGIVARDFSVQSDPAVSYTRSVYLANSYTTSTTYRVNNRVFGPGDTTGRYQTWLETPIAARPISGFWPVSPDRRITGVSLTTGRPDSTLAGRLLERRTTNWGSATTTYVASMYRVLRWANPPALDSAARARTPLITLDEMRFIRAEALFRVGRSAEVPALLNPTRVAAGLQPVTASGPPNNSSCVPRKNDRSCGDLFDAIQYEKRIVMLATDAEVPYYDQRGWGKLIAGTPLELPVSGRDLTFYGLPIYTFGGVAGNGAPAGNP